MTSSTVSCRQAQAAQYHQNIRRLDHLGNIQEGIGFTAIPNCLMDAFIDGRMPEVKYKLICTMLRHSAKFKIKRAYLEKRFSKSTLKKYLPEIEAEGFIRRERVAGRLGPSEVIYHTNRVELWDLPNCYGSSVNGSSVNGSSVNPLNKKNSKEKEEEENQLMDGCKEQEQCQEPSAKQPAIKNDSINVSDLEKLQTLESHFVSPGEFFDYKASIKWFRSVKGVIDVDAFIDYCLREIPKRAYRWTERTRRGLVEHWAEINSVDSRSLIGQSCLSAYP